MNVYTDSTLYDCDPVFEQSDLDWRTRTLLESICASVANVVDDFSADVAMAVDFNV